MITKVSDPLLCITVSTTLRNKPLPVTPPRQVLAALIDAAGGLKPTIDHTSSPVKSNGMADDAQASDSDDEDVLSGLQEVNLLEGLATGKIPNFVSVCPHL